MRLEELKTFCTIIDQKNISKAAAQIGISQQSVSKQLASLEKQVGHTLIFRTYYGAELTDFGKKFYKYAQKVLDAEQKLTDFVASYSGDILEEIDKVEIPDPRTIKKRSKTPNERSNLIAFRKNSGLNINELAEKIGCTYSTYRNAEKGTVKVRKDFWVKLQKAFKLSDLELMELIKIGK